METEKAVLMEAIDVNYITEKAEQYKTAINETEIDAPLAIKPARTIIDQSLPTYSDRPVRLPVAPVCELDLAETPAVHLTAEIPAHTTRSYSCSSISF